MKKIISTLILMIVVFGSLLAVLPYDDSKYLPNSIIMCFKKEAINSNVGEVKINHENGIVQTGVRSFDLLAKAYEFTALERLFQVKDQNWCDTNGAYPMNIFRVTLKNNKNIEAAITALENDANIIYAEYDPIMKVSYVPNDPQINFQYHLEKLQAYKLWDFFRGDPSIVVGIVDSGTKWNHEDLKDNIWINQPELDAGMTINWTNGTVSGGNGVDDDGNGKVDDVIGWDFFSNDNNPYQSFNGNDHGSHVAGCVGAVTDNGVGVASVPMEVRLMITKHQSNTQASTSVSNGYNGIYYCADSGADIINCSWGGPGGGSTANNVINYATTQGSLVMAAAGNDDADHATSPSYPCDATNAVCVAATNQNDEKADFSDYGTSIDLCSPGVAIRSTIYNNNQNTYANFDGTSMATPVAAGVAAMIKATHPNYTPAQIRARIQDTADYIEQMAEGSEYYNKLGSGRVNAFKAILSDVIPNLNVINQIVEEEQGDGDGVPNIGETIRLKLSLENEFNWLNANNIVAKLRNPFDNGVIVIDSVLSYNNIENGFNSYSTNFAKIQIPANYPDLSVPLVLYVTADASNDFDYFVNLNFDLPLSLSQVNWPVEFENTITATSVVVDLNQDNTKVVIVGDQGGLVHALRVDGTELTGFPVNCQSPISMGVAVGNITGDSKPEIVATTQNGNVFLISYNGQILATTTLTGVTKAQTMLADVTGDGVLEVIAATQSRNFYVLNGSTLQPLEGFPIQLDAPIIASMTVADLNADGNNDVLVATSANLHAINVSTHNNISGWPYPMGSASFHGPIVGNFSGDEQTLEIAIAGSSTTNAPITILSTSGAVIANTTTPSAIKTELIAVNVDNEGPQEIVYVDYNGRLFVRNSQLAPLTGYPRQISANNFEGSVVAADVNNDNTIDFCMSDNNGYFYLVSHNETVSFPGFPICYNDPIKTSATIAKLDGDNDFEIIFPNLTKLVCLDYKEEAGDIAWGMYRGNNWRTANVFYGPTANDNVVLPQIKNSLMQNYPNPFNPETAIAFSIKEKSNVKLSVYNIKGQLVKTLRNEMMNAGKHSVVWNGKDHQNRNVTSGVYFYKIETNNFTSTKKMILIK